MILSHVKFVSFFQGIISSRMELVTNFSSAGRILYRAEKNINCPLSPLPFVLRTSPIPSGSDFGRNPAAENNMNGHFSIPILFSSSLNLGVSAILSNHISRSHPSMTKTANS